MRSGVRVGRTLARTALRLRGITPEEVWPAVATVVSLVAGPVVIGAPAARRVLVVAPHPDDETIGCGGTVALLADAGAQVRVLLATDGEATISPAAPPTALGPRRRAEAVRAGGVLGVTSTRALGLPDGRLLDHVETLAAEVAREVAAAETDMVLVPWPLDRHPDHVAAARAVAAAALPRRVEVWSYGCHVPVVPNRLVDVGAVVDRKRAALVAHETAAGAFDLTAVLHLDRWRAIALDGGRGLAEAFLVLDAAAHRRAVTAARAAGA
ncbi:MAG: PIG-L deacetylase family protein [Actinomycetes bacterium]